MKIVNRAFEEALHLRCMKIDRDDVVDTSNIEKIGKHASSNRASV